MAKLLTVFLCLLAFQVYPAIFLADSTANATTNRIDYLNEYGWQLRNSFPDSTIYFAQRAAILADSALEINKKVQSLNYIGVAHRNLSNYSKAFEYYIEALKLSEEHDFKDQKGYSLINLGNLALYQSDFNSALSYFNKGLETATEIADSAMISYSLLNNGRAYRSLNQYDKAEHEFLAALTLRQTIGDLAGVIAVTADLGENSRLQGNYIKALEYLNSSILIAESQGDIGAIVYCRNNIALIYLAQGKIDLAEREANRSLAKAEEYGLRNDQRKGLLTLSTVYESMGDMAKALESKKKYIKLDQEIFSEENIRRVERLKAQYENEKKDAENLYLKNQAQLNEKIIATQQRIIWLTVIAIVLLFIVALVSYYFYRTKAKLSNKIELQKRKILVDKELIEGQSTKLEEINKAKSRFFTNISHDLRSPLSLILGNIDRIKSDTAIAINPSTIQSLDTIERNSKRLLFLTDEINDLTRLEEGKINLKSEIVLLADYLKLLVNMFKSSAQFKGIRLQFMDKCNFPVKAELDPRQFEKIVYNLISNAIKHSDDGDSILVSVLQSANKILIEVSDTGEGIPKKSLPHVFDRFYQAPDKNYRTEEGLGIGLALVKELVELHHGKIGVDSTEGEGTTFLIELPLPDQSAIEEGELLQSEYFSLRNEIFTETERQAALSKKKLPLIEKNTKAEKILIVEDHPEIRSYLRELLEGQYFIMEAGNGKEALSLLKSTNVNLIITDLMMPIMDGFQLLEALYENSSFSTIPVLVVSAKSNENDKERILKSGVNNFLQKPFSKNELLLRIQNLILDQNEKKKNNSSLNSISQKVTQIDSMEVALLSKINTLLLNKINSENFSVLDLAEAIASSERQVYRLVKKLTQMTPNEYIKEFKLQYAYELITKNKVKNASEASREVGIKNVTIFSKDFERKYGKKPADMFTGDKA